MGDILLYGGIAVMASAVVVLGVVVSVLRIARKRLDQKLEQEYGPKRH